MAEVTKAYEYNPPVLEVPEPPQLEPVLPKPVPEAIKPPTKPIELVKATMVALSTWAGPKCKLPPGYVFREYPKHVYPYEDKTKYVVVKSKEEEDKVLGVKVLEPTSTPAKSWSRRKK
jgi:hypothetical protein